MIRFALLLLFAASSARADIDIWRFERVESGDLVAMSTPGRVVPPDMICSRSSCVRLAPSRRPSVPSAVVHPSGDSSARPVRAALIAAPSPASLSPSPKSDARPFPGRPAR